MIEIEVTRLGEGQLIIAEIPVKGILGNNYHTFVGISKVIDNILAYGRFPGRGATRNPDEIGGATKDFGFTLHHFLWSEKIKLWRVWFLQADKNQCKIVTKKCSNCFSRFQSREQRKIHFQILIVANLASQISERLRTTAFKNVSAKGLVLESPRIKIYSPTCNAYNLNAKGWPDLEGKTKMEGILLHFVNKKLQVWNISWLKPLKIEVPPKLCIIKKHLSNNKTTAKNQNCV